MAKKEGTKTGVFAPSYHDKPITSYASPLGLLAISFTFLVQKKREQKQASLLPAITITNYVFAINFISFEDDLKEGTKTGVFAPSYHDKPITSSE